MSDVSLKPLIEHFYKWESEAPDRVFLRQPYADDWCDYSFSEAGQQARKILSAMRSMGLKPGDHVGIYSKNCAHWVMADLAILMGGYVSVPFYASLPKQQLAEVIRLSDIKCLFVGRLDSWADKAEVIPDRVNVIRFPAVTGDASIPIGREWDELLSSHDVCSDQFVPELDDLWTIKFTSGTTGTPKGVMHTHRTPVLIMQNEKNTGWLGLDRIPEIRFLSFLPLNHVGERMGGEVPAIVLGGSLSFVERLDTFAANLRATQPTIFFAVPRIWTKFYLGVVAKIPEPWLGYLQSVPVLSGLLRTRLRTAMGLRDVRIAATGAAITPVFIKRFFRKLGIHLVEAYGMTEVCGVICHGLEHDAPADSVGRVIPYGEIKIDDKSGEVLIRSPYMMQGYYKDPQKTAQVLVDGWLHSGDQGCLDEHGYLRVTGRVKDAFKTAKGSYVVPNPLEEVLAENEYIEQVCVVGLSVPQPLALINLSAAGLAQDRDIVAQSIMSSIHSLNETRAKFEHIVSAVVHLQAWSEHNGLLTPTMKIKRAEMDRRFSDQYLNWVETPECVIWLS